MDVSIHEQGCNKHPGYGYAGMKPTHCSRHRLAGMVDRKRSRKAEPRSTEGVVTAAEVGEGVAVAAAAAAVAVTEGIAGDGGVDDAAVGDAGASAAAAADTMIGSTLYSDLGAAGEAPPTVGGVVSDHHAGNGVALPGFAGDFVFGPDGVPITGPASTPVMPVENTSIGTDGLGAREGEGGGGPLGVPIVGGDALRLEVEGLDSLASGTGGHAEVEGRQRRGRKRPLRTTQCEDSQCFKGPSYGANGTPPLRCALHKMPGDAYVKNQCVYAGCSKVREIGKLCCVLLLLLLVLSLIHI